MKAGKLRLKSWHAVKLTASAAHAEAIKRFYDDKDFAVTVFMQFDRTAKQADVQRLYDLYAQPQAFERVPYVLAEAVTSTINQQSDPQIMARMMSSNLNSMMDNSLLKELVAQGFF